MSKETSDPTIYNKSGNELFSQVLDKTLSRRNFMRKTAGISALTALSGMGLAGCNSSNSSSGSAATIPEATQSTATLGFESVKGSLTDGVVVPEGYSAQILAPWGTPLNSLASSWKKDGTNTAQDQANSVGQNHDGMRFFPLNNSDTDGLLCINHEFITQNRLHKDGITLVDDIRVDIEEVRKEINAHGVTVVRIKLVNNIWQVEKDDKYNRRYTGATPISLAGPVAGSKYVVTPYSPDGSQTRGTLANCGNGFTPWGTYLTCEENWPKYFVNKDQDSITSDQERIGVSDSSNKYDWDHLSNHPEEVEDEFSRFDITPTSGSASQDYRNENRGFGYIVEIDPYNPDSGAVKRTALGRFRHECCAYGELKEGEPVVFYSGHDGRHEYIYKFVSDALWDPKDADSEERMAIGDKYMNEGTLYAAKFNHDGSGEWLPLTLSGLTVSGGILSDSFSDQAEILINAPKAADLVGATKMDRPEWCTIDPFTGSVYMTLTNNTSRTQVNGANPRENNIYGHIIRWDETSEVTSFDWNIFLFGAPAEAEETINRSGLQDVNQFASPDGLSFDDRGILWIQTDNGNNAVGKQTNDQMLAIVPSKITDEDGKAQSVSPETQAQLKRFFVGPNGCEVTGFAITPDYKTIFANVQHPSNWPKSNDATEATPEGMQIRARSATVVFRKNDGSEVGV